MMANRDAGDFGFFLRPEPERNHARAVGSESQVNEIEPLTGSFRQLGTAQFLRRLGLNRRLGRALPSLVLLKTLLSFANGGHVEVDALAVLLPQLRIEAAELVAHSIENAASVFDAAHFAGGFLWGPREEELFENTGNAGFCRQADSATVPRGGASSEDERVEARASVDTRRNFLVEGNAVFDVVRTDEVGVNAGE